MKRFDFNAIVPVSVAMLAGFAVAFGIYMIFIVYQMNINTMQIEHQMQSVKEETEAIKEIELENKRVNEKILEENIKINEEIMKSIHDEYGMSPSKSRQLLTLVLHREQHKNTAVL